VARKQFQGLVAPKQLDQRTRILAEILSGSTERIERDSPDIAANQEHTPPPGNELERSLEVLGANNKGDAVEDGLYVSACEASRLNRSRFDLIS